jgi:ABC-type transport system involved in multi-copper enzyme maturation permease subunit
MAFIALATLTAFFNLNMLGDYYASWGVPGLLSALISALNGIFLPLVVLPLGAVSIGSAIENGTVRVLLSKPLRRRDFFLGTLLSDISAVFIGATLYLAILVAYALHLGAPLSKTLKFGIAFGSLLFLSLVQYLALGYLLSVFMRGRRALFISLVLAFLLGFAVPIAVIAASNSAGEPLVDVLAKNSLSVPSPNLHYTVLVMAVSPKRDLPPRPLSEILNYPGNLGMLIVPTLVYLAIAWFRFKKADLR